LSQGIVTFHPGIGARYRLSIVGIWDREAKQKTRFRRIKKMLKAKAQKDVPAYEVKTVVISSRLER